MKNIKFKKEWSLWISAVVLLLFIIGYTIYSVGFFANNVNAALFEDFSKTSKVIRFDFNKLNQAISGKLIPNPSTPR